MVFSTVPPAGITQSVMASPQSAGQAHSAIPIISPLATKQVSGVVIVMSCSQGLDTTPAAVTGSELVNSVRTVPESSRTSAV